MSLPTVAAAARNNAEWCDLVCRTHGISGTFGSDAWTASMRTPAFYPDAVTLMPSAPAAAILDRVDASGGCSVKDSFATLDLAPHGFRVLFEAAWIARPVQPVRASDAAGWRAVAHAGELDEWQAASNSIGGSSSTFRPALLDDPDVVVLARHRDGCVEAGAILNRAAGVIGLSNLFAGAADLEATWAGAVAAAAHRFPDVAIVGYESGDALAAAHHCEFTSLCALRVWINDDA